jgi:hypothetical protein
MGPLTGRSSRRLTTWSAVAATAAGMAFAAPAPAQAKWLSVGTFSFATGVVSQQIGYNCPASLPVAVSGSFAFNAIGQSTPVYLTFNGTRIDIPSFSEWAWHFYFPNGAPAGVTVQLDVYCVKS